ncbi:MAG: PAS domain S-box protein [Alphaproteobacteria bacterium]|nr:PAS domain S-box protein [Alphaproteobacteria bacterium]
MEKLGAGTYMPHGLCLTWDPVLMWLHAISDMVIAASYFSIPVALGYFIFRRKDLRFRWVFVLFGIFILACGVTHIISIWTLWHPTYWVSGLAKAITAVASLLTAVVLWPLIPRALTLHGPGELARSNVQLEAEIAERLKTEETLRRERDFTKAVIEGLPGIFYVVNTESRLDLWNDNMETVSGYPPDEIGRVNVLDFFEKNDKALIAEAIAGVVAGDVREVEATLVTRRGERIPFYFTGRRLGTGATAKVVGVGINLSARHRLENEALHSSQELERFADISAHHLMEPARRLVSYSQRLRASLAGLDLEPETLLSLGFIENQATRLRALLRDIQFYLVADKPLGETEAVDTDGLVHSLVERMAQDINNVGARITIGKLPPVMIDLPRLSNIFAILLANALQYRRPDVPLEIHISGHKSGGVVRYRVIDNGCGIPAEYRERVFLVFERLQPHPGDDSTGIGLSIIRRIISTRGGRTWIEETPGGGTTVIVELPAFVP